MSKTSDARKQTCPEIFYGIFVVMFLELTSPLIRSVSRLTTGEVWTFISSVSVKPSSVHNNRISCSLLIGLNKLELTCSSWNWSRTISIVPLRFNDPAWKVPGDVQACWCVGEEETNGSGSRPSSWRAILEIKSWWLQRRDVFAVHFLLLM